MSQKDKSRAFRGTSGRDLGCCTIESVVSIDERGQMVLPKEVREKAKIIPGDKLVVITMEREGKFCCLSLIKAKDFEGMVKNVLSPVLTDLQKKGKSR
jgi:AbrB family looped-hinge helix DNA binding protein